MTLVALMLAAGLTTPGPPLGVAVRDPRLRATLTSCRPLPGLRSASAAVWLGDRLLVPQDDRGQFVMLDPRRPGAGRPGAPLSRADKPDWELALTLPDGAALVLGSGARAPRRRIEWVGRDGSRRPMAADRVYSAVDAALAARPDLGDGPPNLEGVARTGEQVLLFHRGSGPWPSATLSLSLACLLGKADPVVQEVRAWDLGGLGGIRLAFSDAATRADKVHFLAVAEDTPDAIQDGPLRGSVLGVLDGERGRWAEIETGPGVSGQVRKFEGLALDPRGSGAWLLSDPDDPDTPAELCRVELSGPW